MTLSLSNNLFFDNLLSLPTFKIGAKVLVVDVVVAVVVVVVVGSVLVVVVVVVVVVTVGGIVLGLLLLSVDKVLLRFAICRSLLMIGIGSSLVSMMLVEATEELKNLDVISLMRPLLP